MKKLPDIQRDINHIFHHMSLSTPEAVTLSPRGKEILLEVLKKYGLI